MSFAALLKRVVETQGLCRIPVTGSSMDPVISEPSQVVIEYVPFAQVECGDVVAFTIETDLLVHRVVARTEITLITSGDNLDLLDPPVHERDYIGRVGGQHIEDTTLEPVIRMHRKIVYPQPMNQVHLWIFVDPRQSIGGLAEFASEWGVSMNVLPRTAIGVSRDTLAELRARLPPTGLKIGVSRGAVASLESLPSLLPLQGGGQAHFLLGCNFGNVVFDEGCLLPPDMVDCHIRLGAPHLEENAVLAAACLLGGIAALVQNRGCWGSASDGERPTVGQRVAQRG